MAITPKYDTDTVTYGYLKEYVANSESSGESGDTVVYKNYSTPPVPPYYKDSLLIIDKKIYRCNQDRLVGQFSWSDWTLITDGDTIKNFIDVTYATDKIELQEQIDDKIETFYQSEDPSTDWSTDLVKEKHVGDYWYDTTTKKQWRYTKDSSTEPATYSWSQVDVPTSVYDLIDTKKSIYTSKPTTYKKDDMWVIEDTISDDDIPVGTDENPIVKGDWVFSLNDSDTYNKTDWVKKDEDVTVDYIQEHYYTKEEFLSDESEVSRNIESKISKSKSEILLEVSTNYITQQDKTEIEKDFGDEIDRVETKMTNEYVSTTAFGVEQDRINGIFTNITKNIDESTGDIKEVKTTTGYTFDEDGLHIEKSGEPTKSKIDEAGIEVQDATSSSNEVQLYAGYVTDEKIADESALTNYKDQTVTYSKNVIFKNYLATTNGRIENVTNSTYGSGIGFFV